MTHYEDTIWEQLVEQHGADQLALPARPARTHTRTAMLAGSGAGVATVATVALLLTGPGAQPAYAMTENPDGSVTVTIHEVEQAVPELNARFAAMGIDETVVPVEAGCTTNTGGDGFQGAPLFVDPQAQASDTWTFTPGRGHLEPGYNGVIAAEQLPDGRVATAVEAIPGPIPSCFPTTAYTLSQSGTTTNGVPIVTATPATGAAG